MLGLGAVYLNKDSPQLTYYKTAVYPVYIVHLPVQMGLMYYFADVVSKFSTYDYGFSCEHLKLNA